MPKIKAVIYTMQQPITSPFYGSTRFIEKFKQPIDLLGFSRFCRDRYGRIKKTLEQLKMEEIGYTTVPNVNLLEKRREAERFYDFIIGSQRAKYQKQR